MLRSSPHYTAIFPALAALVVATPLTGQSPQCSASFVVTGSPSSGQTLSLYRDYSGWNGSAAYAAVLRSVGRVPGVKIERQAADLRTLTGVQKIGRSAPIRFRFTFSEPDSGTVRITSVDEVPPGTEVNVVSFRDYTCSLLDSIAPADVAPARRGAAIEAAAPPSSPTPPASRQQPNSLVGQWTRHHFDGSVGRVTFLPDSTYRYSEEVTKEGFNGPETTRRNMETGRWVIRFAADRRLLVCFEATSRRRSTLAPRGSSSCARVLTLQGNRVSLQGDFGGYVLDRQSGS